VLFTHRLSSAVTAYWSEHIIKYHEGYQTKQGDMGGALPRVGRRGFVDRT